jgi:hypothetical protein
MMLGRPAMISLAVSRDVTLPASIDDNFLTSAPNAPGVQPEGRHSVSAFFVHAVSLLQIVGEILETFYNDDSGSKVETDAATGQTSYIPKAPFRAVDELMAGNYQHFLRLDLSLTIWQDNLPVFLRPDYQRTPEQSVLDNTRYLDKCAPELAKNAAAIFQRQTNVLQARYSPLISFSKRSLTYMV